MARKETPAERKARLLKQLEKANIARQERLDRIKAEKEAGTYVAPPPKPPKRPKNLDKVVREILNDEYLVDLVVQNQPEWWDKLKVAGKPKTAANIIGTVMTVKAMGGDIKAAEWIRKTGYGDKVLLESDNGFFQKSEFTIQVVPAKQLDDGIGSNEVLNGEIRQVEE